jgi:hypothetical protein
MLNPDPPSRHHLPFGRPFDKITVLSKVQASKDCGAFDRFREKEHFLDHFSMETLIWIWFVKHDILK